MAEYRIEPLDSSLDTYVLFGGIKWTFLLGSDLAKKSLSYAKDNKATHYIPADVQSHSAGAIRLSKAEMPPKGSRQRLYSAAAIFAQSHPTGACVGRVKTGPDADVVWVVAVHEGMIAMDSDILCTEAEAEEIIRAFREKHDDVQIIDHLDDPSQFLNHHSQLLALKTLYESVPNSLKLLVVAVMVLIFVDWGWGYLKKQRAKAERVAQIERSVDAKAEWSKALDKWALGVKLDGRAGMLAVYDQLTATPSYVGGWALESAQCVNSTGSWSCSARYRRTAFSTNSSFEESMPKGWSARWDGLVNIIGTWQAPANRITLNRANVTPLKEFNVAYISALQSVLPAYSRVDLASPVKVSIPVPTYSPKNDGVMVPVQYPEGDTKGIELPSTQALKVEGPLRSLLVLPLTNLARIDSVSFKIESRDVRPDLRSSMITAEMVGVMYVQ